MLFRAMLGAVLEAGASGAPLAESGPRSVVWADQVKEPVGWFSWGSDLRLRHDSGENPSLTAADPPGHSCSFERLRVREWNTLRPVHGLELNVRVLWEGRHFWAPASKTPWDRSEILFDTLNFKLRLEGVPVTLVVGRQDLAFGDGWLIFEGTPLDGPRTAYFEAVRVIIELEAIRGTLDLIYIDQTSSPNRRLAPLFSRGNPLMEQDERAAVAYLSTRALAPTQIDAYFISKHDEAVLPTGDAGDVFTAGGRVAHDFSRSVSGRVEGAYQFGHRRNAAMFPGLGGRLSAWGLHGRITSGLSDELRAQAWLGYEVLSGSDARDGENRQFDPLWGRWARYSELFPDDLDRAGDRSNVHRVNLGARLEPVSGLSIEANYHALFPYAHRFSGIPGFTEGGHFKGHLITALVKYRVNRYLSALLLAEGFFPGNFYAPVAGDDPLRTRRDPAAFLRAEVVATL